MSRFFKYKVILLVAASLFFGCDDTDDRPEELISEPVMVELLIKEHLMQARINILQLPEKENGQAVYDILEQELHDEYDIDSMRFVTSYNYYLHHPELFEKLYTAVSDSLTSFRDNKGAYETWLENANGR